MKYLINLLAELNRANTMHSDAKKKVEIEINDQGVFVEKKKVTDIFYNSIQMRFYTSGSHAEEGNHVTTQNSHYMVFENNDNSANLSFKELYEKVSEAFVLSA